LLLTVTSAAVSHCAIASLTHFLFLLLFMHSSPVPLAL
jgi:hypothetical protein